MKKRIIDSDISIISYRGSIERLLDLSKSESSYVCLVNVHMLIEAHDNQPFLDVVNSADLALSDGMPVAKAASLVYGIKQERVAGMDLFLDLMSAAEKKEKSVFLYGTTDEVLDSIKRKAGVDYPKLRIGTYSPPFRELSATEKKDIIGMINDFSPDFVVVALGCPKQEYWMNEHRGVIRGCMIGLGGALPVYAGVVRRAPKWMQNSSLEWLYRLYKEPTRLWKRYLYTNSKFLFLLLIQIIKVRVLGKRR